ncbi:MULTISPECIES: F0F1 ATP synthase subunit gamma [Brucella/Ochrobactrum group]|uniref:ATP synthase gamma chain n=1 Tax=Brucella anthropi (strain ATCC 49188 / DSM 6882 / CCUG 24695 / JCM 21032 / LMG 3331 / NBRC 15819 / NCTC 12168 / Alc 37) TaxID=439375 RepID=ATPG_BRUA4|nr:MULTISPECIES: F0F1 ATP synthase subunit gamma [Brucella/Ochrobactrum group]A6WXX0.1 RecName: Full=ATP synthase gamma chain; AltName: Full=ATP synthase F1 sector gamma subunit; AltName: Full=F-ATPase gamma subunit [Brucella anthropi ATCC 49188]ABS13824.1 ATP synthase F1, gamma subunit [Brucella anthropi ATCC 49188]AIK45157.1 ATP synthase F1, gamma subunit [Brucella anthropi]KAB2733232.1 F0F1 ATP synthase subunit gamma [Brucella anthropi]KAB2744954.1 F0F1 ATP synthase subunit gamma [Brucella 
MPSLKDLRNRIASVKATQKITKAMQMVAAAKLRRAQEAAEAARPYSQRMGAVLANIAQNVTGEDAPALMAGTGKDDVHLLVVCTAERGLCGGFNSQIARLARDHARKLLAEGKTVKIITVGKKGADILRREFASLIIDHVNLREVKQLAFVHADQIGHKVIELFEQGEFDVCTLFYSEFKSVIAQIPTAQQIIPASAGDVAQAETAGDAIYEYEPDPAAILSTLIPRNISVQIFRALLENVAGEMGAKMSAMDNATRNAGDMINKLSITYNRQRQAQITKELIEIISGAEAL